ncbi:anhydro-N-acetylmuramic acid kinase [Streptomyces coryli]|uniref:anhydro-N-acetylmuramic acid kinase n=1 Tax=Streptomyces coryli TaxID=1128680 RepID=UPI0030B90450
MTVVGLLSGTSYDAVDACAAELWRDGAELVLRPLGLHSAGFPTALRRRIAACLPPAATTMEEVCRLDTELGQFFGRVAAQACATVAGGAADLVVSHGQTVYHWVEGSRAKGTLQLGAAAWIAEATGLPVISDLRTRDIAKGGQGAPLASTMDALLLPAGPQRRGALNLGGIANITVRTGHNAGDGTAGDRDRDGSGGGGGGVVAYDLGPANALIDAAAVAASGGTQTMDAGGARAARGKVDTGLLQRLLDEPYYRLPAPKSTGKEIFNARYLHQHLDGQQTAADDVVATVTELTAALVAQACTTHQLSELVVSGGGVRNPVLMARIAARCGPHLRLADSAELGLDAQGKEAYLFALLGYLSYCQLAGNIPSATGASGPAVLGSLTPGNEPLRLPEPATTPPERLRVQN